MVEKDQLAGQPPLLPTLPEEPDLLGLSVVHQLDQVDADHDPRCRRTHRLEPRLDDAPRRMPTHCQIARVEDIDVRIRGH